MLKIKKATIWTVLIQLLIYAACITFITQAVSQDPASSGKELPGILIIMAIMVIASFFSAIIFPLIGSAMLRKNRVRFYIFFIGTIFVCFILAVPLWFFMSTSSWKFHIAVLATLLILIMPFSLVWWFIARKTYNKSKHSDNVNATGV